MDSPGDLDPFGGELALAPSTATITDQGQYSAPDGHPWRSRRHNHCHFGRGPCRIRLQGRRQYGPAARARSSGPGFRAAIQPGTRRLRDKGRVLSVERPWLRGAGASWIDPGGNLWLFGGSGPGPGPVYAAITFNDLWRFAPATGEWTWMSGSQADAQPGIYGTKGVPDPRTRPDRGRIPCSGLIFPGASSGCSGGMGYDSLWSERKHERSLVLRSRDEPMDLRLRILSDK